MARAAVQRRLIWRPERITRRIDETARATTLVLDVPGWPGHRAGQHVDVRLTADDGYQASRSYSIASPPDDPHQVALTIERIEGGEVSPYLVDELREGGELQLRGPIGGNFVWSTDVGGPLLLVAGGPGICLLMAMITHRAARASQVPTRLLYSSRSLEEVIYGQELDRLAGRGDGLEVFHTLTRSRPSDWKGYARRIDRDMLAEVSFPADQHPLCMVCGPTPLVEAVASTLVELGNSPGRVKTERFDPPEDRDDGQHSATTGRQRGSGYVARGFRSGDDIRARRVRLVRNDSADRQAAPVHASAIAGRSATLQHVR